MNINELETKIRRAFDVDKMLPKVGPSSSGSLLGRLMVIPDDQRSYQDVLEDLRNDRRNLTTDDIELWWTVMCGYLTKISGIEHEVVKLRCAGMGWKRIAKRLVEGEFSERMLHRATLWRFFRRGLEDILRKI